MTEVYLLLGSNEGIPEANLQTARLNIEGHCGTIAKCSSIYQTEAWGIKEQNSFLNQALLINTALSPSQLLVVLKDIEKDMGRIETIKWGPRVIDIDILFYGSEVINLPQLIIPHPQIQNRLFTLIPMNEIAPDFIHPALYKTIAELLLNCKDESVVKISIQKS